MEPASHGTPAGFVAFASGSLALAETLLEERVVSSRNRRNPRGIKRKMSNFPLRPRRAKPLPPSDIKKAIRTLK